MAEKMSATQVAMSRIKVKVVKKERDDRTLLCGEEMQEKKNSRGKMEQFFIIPAHQGEYIKKTFPMYIVSEEFEWTPPASTPAEEK